MTKSGKGSSFEREICKKLSLWWTDGKDEDVFWRTAGSGARAKTRSKKNKTTFGQYGDIQATNPIGQPLIDLCSIELKRGYSNSTFADLLDHPRESKEQTYEKFVAQAEEDSRNAKARTWMLVTKRDRRLALVFMPLEFCKKLRQAGSRMEFCETEGFLCFLDKQGKGRKLYVCHLERFLEIVTPQHMIKCLQDWK